ncbi:sensor histidine kinase [Sphingobium nicotianae]|uniref:histidine kinase n=1 Tax=Sphingobium nicotianae TaxID=2782607 RepID=A0A9X1IS82_9SPHN|nr:histidine kinase dimerization/phosphoacceptor domain -containing protein [Sphingobium nicotianae]MBT2188296.1 sensor histidine kinase [Sphingobium nicotianae]
MQLLFGVSCSAALVGLLLIVRLWVPLSAPFAFIFPAILVATLYGRWPAGLAAMISGIVTFAFFILPSSTPLSFTSASVFSRGVIAAVVGSMLLIFAEIFRRTVAGNADARDREIERGEIMLRELEHRTRNNFALVASLLDFQRRQATTPEVIHALDHAMRRVHTFADAYSQLGSRQSAGGEVDMRPYLARLLDRVSDGLFGEEIKIENEIAPIALPSRKAVAIGLYVNEALTNCAKYAFPEGRGGTVKVTLAMEEGGWRLTVRDDGIGGEIATTQSDKGAKNGLGAILFQALAMQAGAKHHVSVSQEGRQLDLMSDG